MNNDGENNINTGLEDKIIENSYEPTTNELDDNNPPSEDSDSSDSNAE